MIRDLKLQSFIRNIFYLLKNINVATAQTFVVVFPNKCEPDIICLSLAQYISYVPWHLLETVGESYAKMHKVKWSCRDTD